MGNFDGQVALVIGGGSGIGRAAAIRLAAEGAIVVVAGRRQAALDETVAAIEAQGGRGFAAVADVLEADGPARAVAAAKTHGSLNVAVNAFGVCARATPIERVELDAFSTILGVNYRGTFLAMQAEARAMIEGKGGAIVNVASVYGSIGLAGHAAYAASKHAVVGLSQTMAMELIGHGVRVNAVCPGLARSPMATRLFPKSLKVKGPDLTDAPDDVGIAEAILWLASDGSRAVFGQAIELGPSARRSI